MKTLFFTLILLIASPVFGKHVDVNFFDHPKDHQISYYDESTAIETSSEKVKEGQSDFEILLRKAISFLSVGITEIKSWMIGEK